MRGTRSKLTAAPFVGALLALIIDASAGDADWHSGWRQIIGPDGMAVLPQDLSVNDVRHMMEHYLEWEYKGRLKLGIVREQDDDSIIAELVSPESYLVQRLEVNRHTGWMRPAK